MRVGRDLLVEVGFARAARPQLGQVVIALDEGHHTQEQDVLRPRRNPFGLEPHAPQQEAPPLFGSERPPPARQVVDHTALGKLDRPYEPDAEGPAVFLLGDGRIVLEHDLGEEPAGQHALVLGHDFRRDPDIADTQAGQSGQIRIAASVQPAR